jgi:hypothetical protein
MPWRKRATVMQSSLVAWKAATGAALRVQSPRRELAVEKLCLNMAVQYDQGQEILSLHAQMEA